MVIAPTTPTRGDVYLIELDPTRGSEIRKTRPCLIISPDELNQHLRTVIVAPMTTGLSLACSLPIP
ncbi:MAG: type II toxin-antitoxin system PemK/MazF family toxin [Nitrospira sp.]|nr:type II toxin-antitoxin system PemK/MazF family toxin [Nitrospira sp.]